MITIHIYAEPEYTDGMWVQQEGYEGAWILPDDKRYKALRPVLDLLEPEENNYDYGQGTLWDEFRTHRISVAEWDSITDGALLP